jgi:hypothetical protein
MLKIDDNLRAKPEYQLALQAALDAYPQMNKDLFDMALMAAYGDPQGLHLEVNSVKDEHNPPISDTVIRMNDTISISEDDTDVPTTDLSQIADGNT